MTPAPLAPTVYRPLVEGALREDLGRLGDLTSDGVIGPDRSASAEIVARAPGCIAGLDVAREAFRVMDGELDWDPQVRDGADVEAGATLATVAGAARPVLAAERTALNFLGRLSGVATATRRLVRAVEGTGAVIADTRKTTPGLRALEKYAVRAGGGANHRFGLDDAVLIKDNHLAVAGGVRAAVEGARATVGHMVRIEVEVDTLSQLEQALEVGVDAVLLDNMSPGELRRAVELAGGRVVTEASGGVTLDTVRAVAETGVDVISVGWITHSAPSLDVALDVVL